MQVMRTTDSSSVPLRGERPPVMSSFTSGPERRLLFDNEDGETYDIRAERSSVIDRPLVEGSREVCSGEPRITSTGMVVRPTPSIETSVSSSEPPRVPVTGILEYGEELSLLVNLELVWVLVPLPRELLLEEVVEVMTLLVIIVKHTNGGPPGGGG